MTSRNGGALGSARSDATPGRKAVVADLARRIDAIALDHPARVAIDGVDGAGKTTLANEVSACLAERGRHVIRASIDGFHNPSAVRRRRGTYSPEGYLLDSFDLATLRGELLEPLGPSGSRHFRRAVFDFRTDARVDSVLEEAPDDSILLFDGVFLLRPEIRDCWDFSIFVRADFAITLARALARDAELFGSEAEVRRRYAERYVPGQKMYLSQVDPERRASVVVDNNDPTAPAVLDGVKALRVDHVGLWVRDLEGMRAFYVNALGGGCGPLYENPRTGFRSYFVSFTGGPRIELMSPPVQGDSQDPEAKFGYAHIALSVGGRAAVDDIVARLRNCGVTVSGGPRLTGDGYYEAVVEDPEGNTIEFVE